MCQLFCLFFPQFVHYQFKRFVTGKQDLKGNKTIETPLDN